MAFDNISTSLEGGPSSVTRFLIMIFLAMIIIIAVVIPVMGDMTKTQKGDVELDLDRDYTYTVTTNAEGVTVTVGGDGAQYCTVTGNVIAMNFKEKGLYTIEITATSVHPTQTATQTITVDAGGAGTSPYYTLLWIVPTMMIIGLALVILRGRGSDDDNGGNGGFGGNGFSYHRYNEGSR